jgi:hypothetical protein
MGFWSRAANATSRHTTRHGMEPFDRVWMRTGLLPARAAPIN